MRSLLLVLALMLVPAALAANPVNDYGPLPTIGGPSSDSRVEPLFSKAASLVSGGVGVEARCWSTSDWSRLRDEWLAATSGRFDLFSVLAYRNPSDPVPSRIHLSSSICGSLVAVAYGRGWARVSKRADLAFAVVTLAHETQHVRGFRSEPVAECYGMQRARLVARALGLTARQAGELVAFYWAKVYPRRPSAYVSASCKSGGRLDLNVTPAWP
jgi:hypothetical protein